MNSEDQKSRSAGGESKRKVVGVGALLVFGILVSGCATAAFVEPEFSDHAALEARIESIEENGIRVSGVIPDREENLAIFGIDLAKKNIEPVWLEIENNTDRQIFFLPTGLDPEYYAPGEIVFGYRKEFSKTSRVHFDEFIEKRGMSTVVHPNSTESGFIFTNVDYGSKIVNVDLLGDDWAKSVSLILSNTRSDLLEYERLVERVESLDVRQVDDESRLQEVLEQLPCCPTTEEGKPDGPFNMVFVGSLEEVSAALVRRNYRVSTNAKSFLDGQPPVASLSKQDSWVRSQPHTVHVWLTDIRFHGDPVWIAQGKSPFGGRFAKNSDDQSSVRIDPDIDRVRDDIVLDMIYSQSLEGLGFVKGAGRVLSSDPRRMANGSAYFTDGLRAILFLVRKPVPISEIRVLDWERLVDHREELKAAGRD